MTLQNTITNLGTAIINLVNIRITKQVAAHCEEIETTLLELKSKVDELVENSSNSSGGNPDNDSPVIKNKIEILDNSSILFEKDFVFTHPNGEYTSITLEANLTLSLNNFIFDRPHRVTRYYKFDGTVYSSTTTAIEDAEFSIHANIDPFDNGTIYIGLTGDSQLTLDINLTSDASIEIQIENNKIVLVKELKKDITSSKNRVDGEKVILTKEYLNKYLSRNGVNFTEDLEIWKDEAASDIMRVIFTTNGVHFYKNNSETPLSIAASLSGITDNGSLVLYWNNSETDFDLYGTSDFDTSENSNEVLFIDGMNTVDRDGTNLGLESFNIGGTEII